MIPVPKGFSFAAAQAGFKKPGRYDLGVICCETEAVAAGVFTKNRFQAAPVLQCKESLAAVRTARAVVANSGQANACTGEDGRVNCRLTLEMVGEALGVDMTQVLPASTGVIGQHLKMDSWREVMPALKESVGKVGVMEFARAIMTTDSFPKIASAKIRIGGEEIRVLGIAKGAGMISPDMATMLGFVMTDAAVEASWWQDALRRAVDKSFNCITVDGDTSTNDTVLALASGMVGEELDEEGKNALFGALVEVCQSLSYMIVQDAEGGTKVLKIRVVGAEDDAQAKLAAVAVGNSPLVKTAMFGQDANWGRIVAALGRSGAEFDPDRVSVAISGVTIFDRGRPVEGDMDGLLVPHMRKQDITIDIILGDGPGEHGMLASDLTHEYISINADYRT